MTDNVAILRSRWMKIVDDHDCRIFVQLQDWIKINVSYRPL